MQATLFLILAPFANTQISLITLPIMWIVLTALAFALTGLGFVLAWTLDSTQGFHAVMNVILFPMWLLSGAVFPEAGASGWVQVVMFLNPMTYGVSAIRSVLTVQDFSILATDVISSLTVIVLFGIATLAASTISVKSRHI